MVWLALLNPLLLVIVAVPPLTDPSCPAVLLQMQQWPQATSMREPFGSGLAGLGHPCPSHRAGIAVAIELGVRTTTWRIDHSS